VLSDNTAPPIISIPFLNLYQIYNSHRIHQARTGELSSLAGLDMPPKLDDLAQLQKLDITSLWMDRAGCRGRPKSNLCSWPPPSQATISASAPLLAPPTAYPLSRDLLTQPRDRPSLSAVDATVYNIMSVRACMATKLRLRAWTS
jgi:hypothetical protein